MLVAGFLKVWPIHLHLDLRMVNSMFSFLVRCHNCPFEITLGHHTLKMYRSLRMVRIWSRTMIFLDSWSRTDFTLELKIVIFIHREINLDRHLGLKLRKQLVLSYTWPQHLLQCRKLWLLFIIQSFVDGIVLCWAVQWQTTTSLNKIFNEQNNGCASEL